MFKLIYESLALITAITIGGIAYGYLNKFLKLFWWQLVLWGFTLILMYLVPLLQKQFLIEPNNLWIANSHMLCEYGFLLTAAYLGCKKRIVKQLVLIGGTIIYGVWLTEFLMKGYNRYFNNTDLTACFVLASIFAILIYRFFHDESELKWYCRPEVVVSIGVLVYFAVSIPYVSIMNYLQQNDPIINAKLLTLLSDTAVNVRYICAAVAFFLVVRNRRELQK